MQVSKNYPRYTYGLKIMTTVGKLEKLEQDSREEILLSHTRDRICTLTLNRPHQRNALSLDLITTLITALEEIERDPEIHVVIFAANGPVYCAGHDLREIRQNPSETVLSAIV